MRYGLPVHVLLRLILGCETASEAVALVKKAPRAGGSHFLVGDRKGKMTGLELTPEGAGEIEPENGVIVHTNHYLVPGLTQKDVGIDLFADTTARLNRASSLLAERPKWDIHDLSVIFTSHHDGPPSICRHIGGSEPEFLRMETIAGCIIDLHRTRMLVSFGQPCTAPYREIGLGQPQAQG